MFSSYDYEFENREYIIVFSDQTANIYTQDKRGSHHIIYDIVNHELDGPSFAPSIHIPDEVIRHANRLLKMRAFL